MVFIGYSHKDRYTVVEPILFHLKHYGFNVWYDFYDMFLGDNRYQKNFIHAISGSKYLIFVISSAFFSSNCAKEELLYAKNLIQNKQAVPFFAFYKYDPKNLPPDMEWIRKFIYYEIAEDSGTLYVANQIVERIINDKVQCLTLKSIDDAFEALKTSYPYPYRLYQSWKRIDSRNYGIRMGILFCIYLYLKNEANTSEFSPIEYIYKQNQLKKADDHLVYSIFEKSITLYLNFVIELPEKEFSKECQPLSLDSFQ